MAINSKSDVSGGTGLWNIPRLQPRKTDSESETGGRARGLAYPFTATIRPLPEPLVGAAEDGQKPEEAQQADMSQQTQAAVSRQRTLLGHG